MEFRGNKLSVLINDDYSDMNIIFDNCVTKKLILYGKFEQLKLNQLLFCLIRIFESCELPLKLSSQFRRPFGNISILNKQQNKKFDDDNKSVTLKVSIYLVFKLMLLIFGDTNIFI